MGSIKRVQYLIAKKEQRQQSSHQNVHSKVKNQLRNIALSGQVDLQKGAIEGLLRVASPEILEHVIQREQAKLKPSSQSGWKFKFSYIGRLKASQRTSYEAMLSNILKELKTDSSPKAISNCIVPEKASPPVIATIDDNASTDSADTSSSMSVTSDIPPEKPIQPKKNPVLERSFAAMRELSIDDPDVFVPPNPPTNRVPEDTIAPYADCISPNPDIDIEAVIEDVDAWLNDKYPTTPPITTTEEVKEDPVDDTTDQCLSVLEQGLLKPTFIQPAVIQPRSLSLKDIKKQALSYVRKGGQEAPADFVAAHFPNRSMQFRKFDTPLVLIYQEGNQITFVDDDNIHMYSDKDRQRFKLIACTKKRDGSYSEPTRFPMIKASPFKDRFHKAKAKHGNEPQVTKPDSVTEDKLSAPATCVEDFKRLAAKHINSNRLLGFDSSQFTLTADQVRPYISNLPQHGLAATCPLILVQHHPEKEQATIVPASSLKNMTVESLSKLKVIIYNELQYPHRVFSKNLTLFKLGDAS